MKRCMAIIMCMVLMASSFYCVQPAQSVEQDAEQESDVFLFPQSDNVSYEPQVVLVELNSDASMEEVSHVINNLGYESTISEVVQGMLRIDFESSWEAEESANALLEAGIAVAAQPNYEYVLSEDEFDGDAAEPIELGKDDLQEITEQELTEVETPIELTENLRGDDILGVQATSVNDPQSGEQWGLSSANVYAAWDLIKGNHKVTVATLDQGCDVNHVDLKANIVDPYNSVDGTTDVSPVNVSDTSKKHGTHVAGVVAGVANNGIGIAGVTYNSYVMPVKVVYENGMAYTASLVRAYDYVMSKMSSRNIRVINLSMGSAKAVSKDDAFIKKIAQAYDKGIVTVAAAGNRGSSNTGRVPYTIYPADYPLIVSVINLAKSGSGVERYVTSNYNFADERTKDISAPGANILSTIPNNRYGTLTGTSMAAPLVSAVLALEFEANPQLTATAAVERLYASATKITNNDFDREYGWGEVNAYKAVYAAIHGADSDRLATVRKSMADEGIPSQGFIDVTRGVSHYDDICWMVENGISTGWDTAKGKEFRPYASVARADMAAFLFRLAKNWGLVSDTWQASSAQKMVFQDVNTNTAHAREIWWLASKGISEGWAAGNANEFRPKQNVARADMAAFIHRLANLKNVGTSGTALTFVDVNARTPHYEDIRWLSSAGISVGWNTTTGRQFRPYANTARADMAVFLHKLDNLG